MTGTAQQIVVWLMRQGNDNRLYDVKEHKDRRSLDSNAYFHVLCDKLRQKLGVSMAYCKNHLVADYGQIEYIDDEQVIYKTNCPEERMMELETPHTKCVKITEEDGKRLYFYRVYRGTRTYNTAEMAQLIEGTVRECEAQDIETATPAELAHMAELWEKKYAKANESVCDNTEGPTDS